MKTRIIFLLVFTLIPLSLFAGDERSGGLGNGMTTDGDERGGGLGASENSGNSYSGLGAMTTEGGSISGGGGLGGMADEAFWRRHSYRTIDRGNESLFEAAGFTVNARKDILRVLRTREMPEAWTEMLSDENPLKHIFNAVLHPEIGENPDFSKIAVFDYDDIFVRNLDAAFGKMRKFTSDRRLSDLHNLLYFEILMNHVVWGSSSSRIGMDLQGHYVGMFLHQYERYLTENGLAGHPDAMIRADECNYAVFDVKRKGFSDEALEDVESSCGLTVLGIKVFRTYKYED